MKLRELINRLEDLSNNGKNDMLDVGTEDYDGSLCGIIDIYVAEEICQNKSYEYIKIEIE